jgi:uncharacterized protein YhfF
VSPPSVPRRPDVATLVRRVEATGFRMPVGVPSIEWFGDSPALVAELGDLVRRGIKRASAGLVASWEAEGDRLPRAGDVGIVIDWSGAPLAVIEVTGVTIQPFDAVDEAFARDEGEGDGTLAWWRAAHLRYFSRECARRGQPFSGSMPVVCWRFRLLHAVPEA